MMQKLLINICLLCGAVSSVNSCIRDRIEPCPPLSVWVGVTDKNYFNVNNIIMEEPVDESLPFNRYISKLHYSLKDYETGEIIVENEVIPQDNSDKTYHIKFCDCIPHGKYILTVFATGTSNDSPLVFDETGNNLQLHPENDENADSFLTTDTLVYDAWNYNFNVGLERAKGKLLVLIENMPSECTRITHLINNLYEIVTPHLNYEGFSFVKKSFLANDSDKESYLTETLLSPSANNIESDYSIMFVNSEGTLLPESEHTGIKINMKRNKLTLIRYKYDSAGKLVISIFVNDQWEVIHGMEID